MSDTANTRGFHVGMRALWRLGTGYLREGEIIEVSPTGRHIRLQLTAMGTEVGTQDWHAANAMTMVEKLPQPAVPVVPSAESRAIADIIEERRHQVSLGYNAEHDDRHRNGELSGAGAAVALSASRLIGGNEALTHFNCNMHGWPDDWDWFGGKTRREARGDLVRAAALIVSEIERIDRERP